MNPIMQNLQRSNLVSSDVLNMYKAYRSASDPYATIRNMAMNNPIISSLINSGNLKDQFYSLCNQRGINPNDILNQFK